MRPPRAIAEVSRASTHVFHSFQCSSSSPRSKGESKRIIDHCWFSPSRIRPLQRWRMLNEAEIGPDGLPCATYGSDHQALMAEFVIIE